MTTDLPIELVVYNRHYLITVDGEGWVNVHDEDRLTTLWTGSFTNLGEVIRQLITSSAKDMAMLN